MTILLSELYMIGIRTTVRERSEPRQELTRQNAPKNISVVLDICRHIQPGLRAAVSNPLLFFEQQSRRSPYRCLPGGQSHSRRAAGSLSRPLFDRVFPRWMSRT